MLIVLKLNGICADRHYVVSYFLIMMNFAMLSVCKLRVIMLTVSVLSVGMQDLIFS
jgi:hypothetical protein